MPPEGALYLALMAVLTVCGAIAAQSAFYRREIAVGHAGRFQALDGLRGVLALSVFVHHCDLYSGYFRNGVWIVKPQSLSFMFGALGVSVFFMITGFLFWTKAIDEGGKFSIWRLYTSRFWRIYPMLMFSLAIVLIITATRSNWQLRETPFEVVNEIGRWLIGGVFGFPAINGVSRFFLNNAGVTWTLQYEVWFYLLLPLTAPLLWRFWRFAACTLFLIATIPFAKDYVNYPNLASFALGILAAYLVKSAPLRMSQQILSILMSFGIIILVLSAYRLPSYSWRFLAFPIFLAVLYGGSLFGILTTSAWKMLGTVSYSIYLIHGSILYVTFSLISRFMRISDLSELAMFSVLACCGVLVVVVSSLTYRWIEYPYMYRLAIPVQSAAAEAA